jgi:hypothetical protein
MQQRTRLAISYMVCVHQLVQVRRADGYDGTVIHVIKENVNSAAVMLVWNPARTNDIFHAGCCGERRKTPDVSCGFRCVREFDLWRDWLRNIRHVSR